MRYITTMQHIADYLGVSVRTVHNRMRDPMRPLPGHKVGGKYQFWPPDVDRWVRSHPQCKPEITPADKIIAIADEIHRDMMAHFRSEHHA